MPFYWFIPSPNAYTDKKGTFTEFWTKLALCLKSLDHSAMITVALSFWNFAGFHFPVV